MAGGWFNKPLPWIAKSQFPSQVPLSAEGFPEEEELTPFQKRMKRVQELQSVSNLGRQVLKQEERLRFQGQPPKETVEKPGPSVVSRVFDLLSRPVYSVANQIKTAIQVGQGEKKPTDLILSAWKGFSGKEKTTASDVLKEAGVKNKVALGVGGFVGDILLDPVTYLSFGTTGAAKAAGQMAGKKLAGDVFKEAVARETATVLASSAQKAAAKGVGAKAAKKLATQDASRMRFKIYDVARKEADAYKAANPDVVGKTQIRLMGKNVGESKSLYKAGEAVRNAMMKSKTVRSAHRLLSTSARVPKPVKERMLASLNQHYFDMEKEIKNFKKVADDLVKKHGLNEDDLIKVSHAIEGGYVQNLPVGQQALAKEFQFKMKEYFSKEKILGLHDVGDELPNYVYHVYRNSDAAEKYGLNIYGKKHVGTENPPFIKEREFRNLQDAKAANLNPVERLDEIFAHRAAKHFEVMARAKFVDDVAKRWGVKLHPVRVGTPHEHADKIIRKSQEDGLKAAGYSPSKSRYLQDAEEHYFDPEVANAIDFTEKLTARDPAAQHFIRLVDKVQNKWKFLATAVNPGFHVRNLIGDTWNNFLDGVVNPKVYGLAGKIVGEGRLAPGRLKNMKVKFGKGLELDGDEIDAAFTANGLRSGFIRTEVGGGEGAIGETVTSAVGKVMQAAGKPARAASEVREDFARMAHFIDAMKKEAKNAVTPEDLKVAAERAASRVRKFNFDYQDLTRFEKSVLRRFVPFYTFMRKNIPLQVEMLATRPGRVAVIPKMYRAIEQATGQPMHDVTFPGLINLTPQWVRESAAARIATDPSGIGGKYLNLDIPTISALKQLPIPGLGASKVLETQYLGGLSPFLKAPFERASGRIFRAGSPAKKDESLGRYLLRQIQPAEQGRKIFGGEGNRAINIANYLAGASIVDVGPRQVTTELRRLQQPMKTTQALINAALREKFGDLPPEIGYASGRPKKLKKLKKSTTLRKLRDLAPEDYGLEEEELRSLI